MDKSTFVIIGGGIAGVSCAEILCHLVPNEKVTLFTASPVVKAVTNVVPLSKMLAKFDVIEKKSETFEKYLPSIKIIQDPISSINSIEHTVTTTSGFVVNYKKMCICSGGIPKLISSSNEFVIGIRDTESVENFRKRINTARRILVVGNGGIATEIVYELSGIEIIWAIKDNHISAPFIDPGASEFFQQKLFNSQKEQSNEKPLSKRIMYTINKDEKLKSESGGPALGPDWHSNINFQSRLNSLIDKKVTVEYTCEVADVIKADDFLKRRNEIDPDSKIDVDCDWPIYVRLTNNKIYGCDLIVSATGVVPNTMFKIDDDKVFDIADDGGIKVNEFMQTNIVNIYAAGDVCTANWKHADHWLQMRLWTQAHQMGCYAGKCMAAALKQETIFQDFCFELFTHVTNFFGFKVVLLGLFNGQKLDGNYSCQLRVTPGIEYIKLVMKGGKMQGAILIGDTDIEEMCENLILNQLDVTDIENDLLNPDIDIDDYFD